MPGKKVIVIDGDEQLIKTFLEASKASGEWRETNNAVGDIIAVRAADNTPVLSGYLKAMNISIADDTEAIISNDVEYAAPIHNGWPDHHISPQPFMDDAYDETEDQWMPLFLDRLVEIVQMIQGAS